MLINIVSKIWSGSLVSHQLVNALSLFFACFCYGRKYPMKIQSCSLIN